MRTVLAAHISTYHSAHVPFVNNSFQFERLVLSVFKNASDQLTFVPSVTSALPACHACDGSASVSDTVKSMNDSFGVRYEIDVIEPESVTTIALMFPVLLVSALIVFVG